jgi:membrane protease YdiL (CAAX protease family)
MVAAERAAEPQSRPLMSSTDAPPAVIPTGSPESPIAPAWHTTIVLCVMLGTSLLGASSDLPGFFGLHGRVPSYALAMVIEWGTVALIWWGLRPGGVRISDLIGGSWTRGIQVVRDFGIGIAFIVVFGGALQGLCYLLHVAPPESMRELLPKTPVEMLAWVALSMTGGFCEEVIFRGYLQRQFSAFTHFAAGGIVIQGMVFGLSHGYQGWKMMALIALYGVCFGLLARWRQSLRPGIVGHILQDTAGGLLARFGS